MIDSPYLALPFLLRRHQPSPFDAPMIAGLGVSWGKLVPWVSGVVGMPQSRSDLKKERALGFLRCIFARLFCDPTSLTAGVSRLEARLGQLRPPSL